MVKLVESVLAKRVFNVFRLQGFKAETLPGTDNICECDDDGGDGCSE